MSKQALTNTTSPAALSVSDGFDNQRTYRAIERAVAIAMIAQFEHEERANNADGLVRQRLPSAT
jgi:hypothetical protein